MTQTSGAECGAHSSPYWCDLPAHEANLFHYDADARSHWVAAAKRELEMVPVEIEPDDVTPVQ